MKELEEMKARLAAATPGPWRNDGNDSLDGWEFIRICAGEYGPTFRTTCEVQPNKEAESIFSLSDEDLANAELISHAPTDISRLIQAVEVLFAACREIVRRSSGDLTWQSDGKDLGIAINACEKALAILRGEL